MGLVIGGLAFTEIAQSGIIPCTLLTCLESYHVQPMQCAAILAARFAGWLFEPLLLGLALARFNAGREMVTCLTLCFVVSLISIGCFTLDSLAGSFPIAEHFFQTNLLAALLIGAGGVLGRLRFKPSRRYW